jgi:hypothetical protein
VEYLYVIENETARLRKVTPGIRSREMIEIAFGVTEGDLIVRSGKETLEDGVTVTIRGEDRK